MRTRGCGKDRGLRLRALLFGAALLGLAFRPAPVQAERSSHAGPRPRGQVAKGAPARRPRPLRLRAPASRPLGRAAVKHELVDVLYPALRREAQRLLLEFPPGQHYFIGVGRTPTPMIAFLRNLSPELATSVPASGLKRTRPEHLAAYFDHFDHFVPPDVLRGDRTVVFLDGSSNGGSAEVLETLFNRYQAARGARLETQVTVWDEGGETRRSGRVRVFGAPEYPFMESDSIAVFDRAHYIGEPGYALKTLRYARNPEHAQFRRALMVRMKGDAELGSWLRTQFPGLVTDGR